MHTHSSRLVLAAVLVIVGALCWRAGRIEGRMAAAGRDLATLRYALPLDGYDQIAAATGTVDRLWRLVLGRTEDLERQRATARYWLGEFDVLRPERDVDGALVDEDPLRLFVGANAAYRAVVRAGGDPEVLADRLGDVLSAYADVLRADPNHPDSAYNYEFVARLRRSLDQGQRPPKVRFDASLLAADSVSESGADADPSGAQLPDGPTLHGLPGGPPPDMTLDQLLMYAPLRPTEREESDAAGKGPRKARKG